LKRFSIFFFALTLLSTLWIGQASAEEQYIKRAAVTGRSGPGTFFDAIVVLKRGRAVTVTERVKRWAKVTTGKHNVWVPTNGLERAPEKSHKSISPSEAGDVSSSPAGLAAAAKGFAKQFAKRIKAGDMNLLLRAEMSPQAFSQGLKRFHATHPERSWPFAKEYKAPPAIEGWEAKIGLAVAAKLVAHYGIVDDLAERRSLTLLANIIGRQSARFDLRWRVLVLDSAELNAFGLSDGYILVTRGLLAACHSLEERAAILAHEVAHVVRFHNLSEVQERKVYIEADAAQQAMDTAFNEEPDEVVTELSQVALDAYTFLHKDRLASHEFEADQLAAIYLYRSGLPPHALVNILKRVERERGEVKAYSGHPPFKTRIKRLKRQLKKMR